MHKHGEPSTQHDSTSKTNITYCNAIRSLAFTSSRMILDSFAYAENCNVFTRKRDGVLYCWLCEHRRFAVVDNSQSCFCGLVVRSTSGRSSQLHIRWTVHRYDRQGLILYRGIEHITSSGLLFNRSQMRISDTWPPRIASLRITSKA